MNELNYLNAVLLGIVQGLTEFLPISSSGHLAMTQKFMGLDATNQQLLFFDILMHLGTLIAVGYVFAPPMNLFLRRLHKEILGPPVRNKFACRLTMLAIIAVIPTGIIGVGFKDEFEKAFGSATGISIGLVITGVLLALTAVVPRGKRGWKKFAWWQALLIGIAQGAAIMPGISRSGSTICMASFCGIKRQWAAQFSFLIVAPVIVGAAILQIKDLATMSHMDLSSLSWGPLIAGTVVATIVGVMSLRVLLSLVRNARLHLFTPYCWMMAIIFFFASR